jgi:hypothetical protein
MTYVRINNYFSQLKRTKKHTFIEEQPYEGNH